MLFTLRCAPSAIANRSRVLALGKRTQKVQDAGRARSSRSVQGGPRGPSAGAVPPPYREAGLSLRTHSGLLALIV